MIAKSLRALILLGLFFVYSCEKNNKDDQKITVDLLQLNDVYEISPLEGGKVGGLARVETLHRELLQKNPNTYMFMAGDFLNPSLIGTLKYQGERIRGRQMIETMNAMDFDLVTFGNHEFDLKYSDLQKRLDESCFPWTSANTGHILGNSIEPFYTTKDSTKLYIPDTYIFDLENKAGTKFRLGVFSICVDSNPKKYVKYYDYFEKAQQAYDSLKDKVDVVIGFTHLKKEDDLKILEQLPNVPLIMGGHEHYNMYLKASTGGILAKADANAKTVYLHHLTIDKETKKVSLQSDLIPITDSIKPEKSVQKIVTKWQAILDAKVKNITQNPEEVVYFAKTPLDAREKTIRHKQSNMGAIITNAFLYGSKNHAEMAIVNSGSIRIDDQLEGNIIAMDWFRTLPYGGSAIDITITGKLLKEVLDYGESHNGTGAYLQRSPNVTLENDVWKIAGKPLNEKNNYNIVVSDYLLKGFDIPLLKEDAKGVLAVNKPKEGDVNYDIRNAIIAYLKDNK